MNVSCSFSSRILSLFRTVFILPVSALVSTQALAFDEQSCLDLQNFSIPGQALEIVSARWETDKSVPQQFPGAPAVSMPVHCHVEGMLDRRTGVNDVEYGIRFAVNLPEEWNGRFLFQGGGGLNGSLSEPRGAQATGGESALSRGFAVASTDSGHRGQGGFDASFMSDQEAALNFFYKANAKVTVVAKEVVNSFYTRPADNSYFVGCSTGGREGMIMSQRFPDYYDGIVSGAPAIRTGLSNLAARWVTVHQNQVAPKDANGLPAGPAFSPERQAFIVDGLLQSCDALDGVDDGLIFNVRACNFDPHVLACDVNDSEHCLSDAEAEALAVGFAGPVDSRGVQVYPGFLFDTGIDDVGFIPGLIAGSANPVGAPNAQLLEQDVDAEFIAATDQNNAIGDSVWLNLSTFRDNNGKLLFYHGNSDPWFSALDTVAYYEDMSEVNGGMDSVRDWSRVYLVPGMGHCQGGTTVDSFDMLSAIVDWVENDQAPDSVRATGQSMPGVSRPLCPWPEYPRYNGSGDPDNADNFSCVE